LIFNIILFNDIIIEMAKTSLIPFFNETDSQNVALRYFMGREKTITVQSNDIEIIFEPIGHKITSHQEKSEIRT